MLIRKNISPRTLKDALCLTFVILIIPAIYYFELFIVIPTYYPMWSLWYTLHFLCGNFVAINILTNLILLLLVDTSVKGRILAEDVHPGWRFCFECDTIVPPRSWHCDICKTCILKRDHHCIFVGTCVGHDNARYFMIFMMYLFAATAYSTYFNSFFIWKFLNFSNKWGLLKIIFPLAMLALDVSFNQLYIFLFLIVIFGMVFTGVLLCYHFNLIVNGQTTNERSHNLEGYKCNTFIKNIEMVFGRRWYLTWINAFVLSKLPHDGVNWKAKETIKTK